jgi:hypothetical protein
MPSRTLPNVQLKAFWALGEDNYKDEMDLNLLKLSVLVQGGVIDKVAALPGVPADGDVYLLDETAGGDANKIAVRDAGAWVYFTPEIGWLIYDLAGAEHLTFGGATWSPLISTLPDVTGNGGKYLAAKMDETGYELIDPPGWGGEVFAEATIWRIEAIAAGSDGTNVGFGEVAFLDGFGDQIFESGVLNPSSSKAGFSEINMVDGSTAAGNGWMADIPTTEDAAGAYWEVEFAAPITPTALFLWPINGDFASAPEQFKVRYYDTGTLAYVDVGTFTTTWTNNDQQFFQLSPIDTTTPVINVADLPDTLDAMLASEAVSPLNLRLMNSPVAVAYSATLAYDLAAGRVFTTTLTGDLDIDDLANARPGQVGKIVVTQDGTGGWLVTFTGADWIEVGADVSADTAPGAVTVYDYFVGTSVVYVSKASGGGGGSGGLTYAGTAAQGDILYRGASGWELLTPGSPGEVLVTQGPAANPAWVAAGYSAGGILGKPWDFQPPEAGDFALLSGDATNLTISDDADVGLMMDSGAMPAAAPVLRTAYMTLTTPSLEWEMKAKFKVTVPSTATSNVGIFYRDPTSGRTVVCAVGFNTSGLVSAAVSRYTSLTAFSASGSSHAQLNNMQDMFLRITKVNASSLFVMAISMDGKNWRNFNNDGFAFIINAPSQVGIVTTCNRTASDNILASCPYFSLTGPAV